MSIRAARTFVFAIMFAVGLIGLMLRRSCVTRNNSAVVGAKIDYLSCQRRRALHSGFALSSLLFLSFGLPAATPDGYYDTSWGSGGTIHFSGEASVFDSKAVEQIIVEPTGRLLVGGTAYFPDSGIGDPGRWYLGELLANGSLSPTFGASDGSGLVWGCSFSTTLCASGGGALSGVALQPDSSIVTSGSSTLARLTSGAHALATGSVSGGAGFVTFKGLQINDVKGAFTTGHALLRLASGKWLLGGEGYYSQAASDNSDFAVIRLNADFSLDTTFNAHTDGSGVTFAGGQIVSFDLSGNNNDAVWQIALQSDGRIMLAGAAETSTGVAVAVARLNADGTLDLSYGGGAGKVVPNFPGYTLSGYRLPHGAKIDAADRLLVAAEVMGPGLSGTGVLRLLTSGAPDTNFSGSGLAYYVPPACSGSGGENARAAALALDSAGRILAAGSCIFSDGTIQFLAERLHGDDGYLDTSFGNSGFSLGVFAAGNHNEAFDVVIDASGRPVFGGYTFQSGTAEAGLARLTYDLVFTNNFELVPPGRLPGQ